MSRRRLHETRALITGASSGIGEALARELASHQARLILLARRAARLEQLAEEIARTAPRPQIVAGDVTDITVRQRALAACDELGGLDVLINNAGITSHVTFADGEPAHLREILEVNFLAAAELTREALPQLRCGTSPIIVNVGSILGMRGVPLNSAYCASKFALHGWSEAIRTELSSDGIDVLVVAPGRTDTELFDNAIGPGGDVPWSHLRRASPQQLAKAILRGTARGKHLIIPDWPGWLLVTANRFFPSVVDYVLAKMK